jgi:tetratricopeptide (TPR) repeat protein
VDERVRQAGRLYERAVFTGDAEPLGDADQELDAAEADLAMARGKVAHARFLLRRDQDPSAAEADPGELPLFERAAGLYRGRGDTRGEADALFWAGCFHQVIAGDTATALPLFWRSLELASQAGDKAVMAETLRHLGIAAHASGDMESARQRLEESTRLRHELGFLPGVASNLVGLACIAAAQGRSGDALALIAEGSEIARDAGAARTLAQFSEARAAISVPHRNPGE